VTTVVVKRGGARVECCPGVEGGVATSSKVRRRVSVHDPELENSFGVCLHFVGHLTEDLTEIL
jgi:hypothetical protein